MARLGMDVSEVRSAAQQLDSLSGQIDGLIGSINSKISGLHGIWEGSDVQQFVAEWQGSHQPNLKNASQAVKDLAAKARRNADQQEQTSSQL